MAQRQEDWVDAQPLLQRVCAAMAVGELLHGESFSLFESTTAIEIGDPKMDIGLHRDKETKTAGELIEAGCAPASLAPPLLLAVMDRLLCLEANWHRGSMLPQTVFTSLYMLQPDRLASCAPLHAYCMALRSICTVLVDMAHAAGVTEDEDFFVHTFGMRMLDMPGCKPMLAALQTLAVAEEQVEAQLEQWVSGGGSSGTAAAPESAKMSRAGGGSAAQKSTPAGSESLPGKQHSSTTHQQQQQQELQQGVMLGLAQQPTSEQAAALLARIRFRRLVLEALHSLQQYSQAGVEAARKQCQLAVAQLDLLAGSAALAAPFADAPGFVPDVNRQHMGLVPPRPVHEVTLSEAVEHWRSLLSGLADALHALLFVRGSWAALRATLLDFASHNHHAIVRSAMHLQLIKPLPAPPPPPADPSHPPMNATGAAHSAPQPNGKANNGSSAPAVGGKLGSNCSSSSKLGSTNKESKGPPAQVPAWCPGQEMVCREFGLAKAGMPPAGSDAVFFIEQAAIGMQGQVHALCLNRCRQRRRLRHQMEDWKNIFDHGFNADVTPEMQQWLARAGWRWQRPAEGSLEGQGPAATWALREGAACGLLHLQLGFPLELYSPDEYRQIYWYCDYLLDWQLRAAHALHATGPAPGTQQQHAQPSKPGSKSSSKQRGGRGSSATRPQGGEQGLGLAGVQLLLLEVDRLMCQGMFRAAIGMRALGLMRAPDAPFNTEEQRYEQRFVFLEQSRIEQVPYAEFAKVADPQDLQPAAVLASAFASFQIAGERAASTLAAAPLRPLLREKQLQHLAAVQRTAAQNMVACKLLATMAGMGRHAGTGAGSQGQQPQQFSVHFDFKASLQSCGSFFFPAIVLKR